MPRDPRAYLWDVREAADAIEEFVTGVDAESYAATRLVHSAVERQFEIIGEALGQLARVDSALAARVPHLAPVIAFRNLLIHGYATVQHATVWNIIPDTLPPLRASVRTLFAELGKD